MPKSHYLIDKFNRFQFSTGTFHDSSVSTEQLFML